MSEDIMADLPLVLSQMTSADLPQVEKLDRRCFGPGRFARTAYRLRENTPPLLSLSRVARIGSFLVGANLMTPIQCGNLPGLLLGPLTVEPPFRTRGIGETLVQSSLAASHAAGYPLVILVGDAPYYQRMGFTRVPVGKLTFPGPVDPNRLLYCALEEGCFENVHGEIRPL